MHDKFYDVAGKILFYAFFLQGTIFLVFEVGKKSSMVWSFVSFIFCWGFKIALEKKDIYDRTFLWFLINIGFWLGLLGEMFFYYHLTYYDKSLHIFVGMLLAEVLFQYYNKHLKVKKEAIFFSVLGLLAIWEIYEYFIFAYFAYPTMGVFIDRIEIMSPLADTMTDLIGGSIGAILFLIFREEKKQFKKVENKLKTKLVHSKLIKKV